MNIEQSRGLYEDQYIAHARRLARFLAGECWDLENVIIDTRRVAGEVMIIIRRSDGKKRVYDGRQVAGMIRLLTASTLIQGGKHEDLEKG